MSWWKERLGAGGAKPAAPSFAHVFGWVLVMLLAIEAITGAALAAFYSPSTTDAWASVAYLQDQAEWGWIVRGLHYHGASAIVMPSFHIATIGLLKTAVKDPDGDALKPDASAVQFGRSTICSFSPVGSSTPGTVYLIDGGGQLWAARCTGAGGRVRVLRSACSGPRRRP